MIDHNEFERLLDAWDQCLVGVDRMPPHDRLKDHSFKLTKRAALIRQRDALRAALSMSRTGHGAFAVTFLRPAFEELVWIEYLNKHKSEADELIILILREAVGKSLKAQRDYISPKGMVAAGIPMSFVKRTLARQGVVKEALLSMGRKLGWMSGSNEQTGPSLKHVATSVGRIKEYNFLYHGTSRFVHFSVAELFRRAWGHADDVTISTKHFERYWVDFALYWGSYIFLNLMSACESEIDAPIPQEVGATVLEVIESQLKQVPIITGGELNL